MQITCPACQAAYDVPDARLAPGRAVRCARCGARWMPLGEAPARPAPASPAPAVGAEPAHVPTAPEASRDGAAEAPPPSPPRPAGDRGQGVPRPEEQALGAARPRSQGALTLAWVASALAVLGAGAVAVVWRAEVMETWPPSVRVYRMLGLD